MSTLLVELYSYAVSVIQWSSIQFHSATTSMTLYDWYWYCTLISCQHSVVQTLWPMDMMYEPWLVLTVILAHHPSGSVQSYSDQSYSCPVYSSTVQSSSEYWNTELYTVHSDRWLDELYTAYWMTGLYTALYNWTASLYMSCWALVVHCQLSTSECIGQRSRWSCSWCTQWCSSVVQCSYTVQYSVYSSASRSDQWNGHTVYSSVQYCWKWLGVGSGLYDWTVYCTTVWLHHSIDRFKDANSEYWSLNTWWHQLALWDML